MQKLWTLLLLHTVGCDDRDPDETTMLAFHIAVASHGHNADSIADDTDTHERDNTLLSSSTDNNKDEFSDYADA